jgi:hypothetical protein
VVDLGGVLRCYVVIAKEYRVFWEGIEVVLKPTVMVVQL